MHTSILFNSLKHHLAFIQHFIALYPENEWASIHEKLLPIGHSQMDVYTGQLNVDQLSQEIVQKLHQQNIDSALAFKNFLLPTHFQTLILSDESCWIVRWGEKEGQYIHIHPGRYSPHTVRVKATSLKTAIAVQVAQRFWPQPLEPTRLNQLRTERLNLSPIKHTSDIQGIKKVIDLLQL